VSWTKWIARSSLGKRLESLWSRLDANDVFRLKKVQGKKKRDAGKAEMQAITDEQVSKPMDEAQEPTVDLLSTKDEDVIF
jgi:V-type H+-transporting ATPase subunit D